MMDFGDAIKHLKAGRKLQREGWNGKGMFIYLATQLKISAMVTDGDNQHQKLEPCIIMKTAQGTFQPGWLASQPDMLSSDWRILDG